jgi:hypothetical protein
MPKRLTNLLLCQASYCLAHGFLFFEFKGHSAFSCRASRTHQRFADEVYPQLSSQEPSDRTRTFAPSPFTVSSTPFLKRSMPLVAWHGNEDQGQ